MHVPSGVLFRPAGSRFSVLTFPVRATVITTFEPAGGMPCSAPHCRIPDRCLRTAALYISLLDNGFGGALGPVLADPAWTSGAVALPASTGAAGCAALPASAAVAGPGAGVATMLTVVGRCCVC